MKARHRRLVRRVWRRLHAITTGCATGSTSLVAALPVITVDEGQVEEILSGVPYSPSLRASHLYLLFEGKIPDFFNFGGT